MFRDGPDIRSIPRKTVSLFLFTLTGKYFPPATACYPLNPATFAIKIHVPEALLFKLTLFLRSVVKQLQFYLTDHLIRSISLLINRYNRRTSQGVSPGWNAIAG